MDLSKAVPKPQVARSIRAGSARATVNRYQFTGYVFVTASERFVTYGASQPDVLPSGSTLSSSR